MVSKWEPLWESTCALLLESLCELALCGSVLLLRDDWSGTTETTSTTVSQHSQIFPENTMNGFLSKVSLLRRLLHNAARSVIKKKGVKLASVLMVESRSMGPLSTLAPDEHLARASACFSRSLWRTMASQPLHSFMVSSYMVRIRSSSLNTNLAINKDRADSMRCKHKPLKRCNYLLPAFLGHGELVVSQQEGPDLFA